MSKGIIEHQGKTLPFCTRIDGGNRSDGPDALIYCTIQYCFFERWHHRWAQFYLFFSALGAQTIQNSESTPMQAGPKWGAAPWGKMVQVNNPSNQAVQVGTGTSVSGSMIQFTCN